MANEEIRMSVAVNNSTTLRTVKLRAVAKSGGKAILALGVDGNLYRYQLGQWRHFPATNPFETFEIIERIYPSAVYLTSRTIEVNL